MIWFGLLLWLLAGLWGAAIVNNDRKGYYEPMEWWQWALLITGGPFSLAIGFLIVMLGSW